MKQTIRIFTTKGKVFEIKVEDIIKLEKGEKVEMINLFVNDVNGDK